MAANMAPAAPSAGPPAGSRAAEPAPAGGVGVYAVARVGAQHIAIANAVVSQAVACPERLVTLPRRAGALEGLLCIQGQWVPVVRLGHWVDLGEAPEADGQHGHILVLRQAGQVIGLLVDRVLGVRRVGRGDLALVYHDERPDELFQSVITAQGDLPALSVLEAHRLMSLAAAWCEAAAFEPTAFDTAGAAARARGGDATRHAPYATFCIGDLWVGIAAADIGELIPAPPMQAVMLAGSAARGICTWRGLLVPVVDLAGVLACGVRADAPPSVCIVRQGELAIGVLVHEVGALTAVDAAGVERHDDSDPGGSVLLGATVTGAGGMLQLLDTARLMACFPETALSAPRAARPRDTGGRSPRCAEAFIVFSAGSLQATPATQVQEVVSLPPALLARLDAGQPATLPWRGLAVPVVDLRLAVAGAQGMRPSHLVIVANGERRAAVTIAGVTELIAAHSATRTRISAGAGRQFDMVTVDGPGQKVSYTVLDLASFISAPVAREEAVPA